MIIIEIICFEFLKGFIMIALFSEMIWKIFEKLEKA